jgi:isocitrate lyase
LLRELARSLIASGVACVHTDRCVAVRANV